MWNGEDAGVGGFLAAFVEERGGEAGVFDAQAAERGTEGDFAATLRNGCAARIIKLAESNGRNAHAIAGFVGEDGLPEDVNAIAGVNALELFRKGADEYRAPEPADGRGCLFAAMEPFEHGDAAGDTGVGGMAARGDDGVEGAGNSEFVFESERRKGEERAGHVKRSGEKAGMHLAAASFWVEQDKTVEKTNFVRGTNAPIEIFEVRTATEGDVLTIVHVFAIGQDVGSSTSAEERTPLEETDAPASVSQRDAG